MDGERGSLRPRRDDEVDGLGDELARAGRTRRLTVDVRRRAPNVQAEPTTGHLGTDRMKARAPGVSGSTCSR